MFYLKTTTRRCEVPEAGRRLAAGRLVSRLYANVITLCRCSDKSALVGSDPGQKQKKHHRNQNFSQHCSRRQGPWDGLNLLQHQEGKKLATPPTTSDISEPKKAEDCRLQTLSPLMLRKTSPSPARVSPGPVGYQTGQFTTSSATSSGWSRSLPGGQPSSSPWTRSRTMCGSARNLLLSCAAPWRCWTTS
jgi:hypothetical protein